MMVASTMPKSAMLALWIAKLTANAAPRPIRPKATTRPTITASSGRICRFRSMSATRRASRRAITTKTTKTSAPIKKYSSDVGSAVVQGTAASGGGVTSSSRVLPLRGEVRLEWVRDVGWQTLGALRGDGLEDVRVSALDRGGLAGQVDRHLNGDFLLEADRVEVDVDGPQAPRMGLDLANEDFLGSILVDNQVDQVGPSGLDEHLLELKT